jgi:hypothetical protein
MDPYGLRSVVAQGVRRSARRGKSLKAGPAKGRHDDIASVKYEEGRGSRAHEPILRSVMTGPLKKGALAGRRSAPDRSGLKKTACEVISPRSLKDS